MCLVSSSIKWVYASWSSNLLISIGLILLSFLLKENQLFLAFMQGAAAGTSGGKKFKKSVKIPRKIKLEFYISFNSNTNNICTNPFSFHFGISYM